MPERKDNRDDATTIRENVSHWQLAARTEVRRSSSLPSSMFDACDPMLEAQLVESVEKMLNGLRQPGPEHRAEPDEHAARRTEQVGADELAELPAQLAGALPALALEDGHSGEYLSLLIDTCTTGDDDTATAARTLLQRDFGIESACDLEEATAALVRCLPAAIEQGSEGAEAQRRLTELCSAIAASVVVTPEGDDGAAEDDDR